MKTWKKRLISAVQAFLIYAGLILTLLSSLEVQSSGDDSMLYFILSVVGLTMTSTGTWIAYWNAPGSFVWGPSSKQTSLGKIPTAALAVLFTILAAISWLTILSYFRS